MPTLSQFILVCYLLLTPFLLFAGATINEHIVEIKAPSPHGKSPHLSVVNDTMLLSWTEQDNSGAALKFSTFKNKQWSIPKIVTKGSNWFVNYADYAKVTVLSNNHYIANWLVYNDDSSFAYHFMVSQSFDAGLTWSSPLSAIEQSLGEDGFVSVIKDNNNVLLTWISTLNNGKFAIKSALLDEKNNLDDITIIDSSSCSCCHTDLIKFNNKILLVYRDRTEQEIRDIALSTYQDSSWNKPKIIHNDQWKIKGCPVNAPTISSNSSGYAIAWFSAANNQPKINLLAQNSKLRLFQTLESDDSLGYLDMIRIDNKNLIISWLSYPNNDLTLTLQPLDLSNLSLKQPIIIQRDDISGFPSITHFIGHTYITYATSSVKIIVLKTKSPYKHLGIESAY